MSECKHSTGKPRNANNSYLNQNWCDGINDVAFALGVFGIWLVGPILHGAFWPLAAVLVERFYGVGWVKFALVTHILASIVLAYSGAYALLHMLFAYLQHRRNNLEN